MTCNFFVLETKTMLAPQMVHKQILIHFRYAWISIEANCKGAERGQIPPFKKRKKNTPWKLFQCKRICWKRMNANSGQEISFSTKFLI